MLKRTGRVQTTSTVVITKICIPPDRDGETTPRRKSQLSSSDRPQGLCLLNSFPYIPLSLILPSSLPAFIFVSSLLLLQLKFLLKKKRKWKILSTLRLCRTWQFLNKVSQNSGGVTFTYTLSLSESLTCWDLKQASSISVPNLGL